MILDEILVNKRAEVTARVERRPEREVAARAEASPPPRDFLGALRAPGLSIIAEIKRHSPAKGALRLDMDAPTMATTYAQAGASCISVLTDEKYFKGSDADLVAVRQAIDVPVLRKDFVVSSYQVYEARALGADAVLLIVAALTPAEVRDLSVLAASLGMAALVEVHTEHELQVALDRGVMLLGINNRDLTRMVTDLETTFRLLSLVPPDVTLISESGIRTAEDIARLASAGVDGALIGESLVTAPDASVLLRDMLAAGRARPTATGRVPA